MCARNGEKRMGNHKKQHSLRFRITLATSLLCAGSLILLELAVYFIAYRALEKNYIQYTSTNVNQTIQSLDIYLEDLTSILRSIAVGEDFIGGFQEDSQENLYELRQRNNTALRESVIHRSDIENIILYNDQSRNFHTLSSVTFYDKSPYLTQLWGDYKNKATILRFSAPHIPDYYNASRSVITISVPVLDLSLSENTMLALALMDINFFRLDQIFNAIQMDESAILVVLNAENDWIYSHNLPEEIRSETAQTLGQISEEEQICYKTLDQNYLVAHARSTVSDWKMFYLLPSDRIQSGLQQTLGITILVTIVALFASFLIAAFLTRISLRPVQTLIEQMKKVEKGDLSIRIPWQNQVRDFNILSSGFNHMMEQIQSLMEKNQRQERAYRKAEEKVLKYQIAQKEAELKALQAKMNPHFLYNSLQTIKALAVLEETQQVEVIAVMLGKMLEYLTYENDALVSVEKELNYIESFLAIQKIRFEGQFTAYIDVEKEIYDCKIMKLLLQPLVENTFKHAFKEGACDKKLEVIGRRAGSALKFVVRDNGAGMDEETLENLKKHLENDNEQEKVGLKNVYTRLRLRYGERARLDIESAPQCGCTITVLVPIEEGENADSDFDR